MFEELKQMLADNLFTDFNKYIEKNNKPLALAELRTLALKLLPLDVFVNFKKKATEVETALKNPAEEQTKSPEEQSPQGGSEHAQV